MGREKRKFSRFEFDHDVMVFDAQNNTLIGHLENLSLEGMMLTSESLQAVDQEYHVHFFPRTEIEGISTIECRICSVWSGENMWRESEPSKQYCTGYKIVDIADTELKMLDAYIRTSGHASD